MSALVASLFAVGASPAAAIDEDSKPNEPAPFKACVGDATDDQGFTDLGSLMATVPNINCLAYYGITVGKTLTTFDPNSNVTRSEMALFLYRAADLMGVDLMGGDMMVDYGDIAELGEDRQNAITALARNGILSGRGSMAFEPYADITRAEMAIALVALLDHTPGAPVHKPTMGDNAGLYTLGATADAATPPDDRFDDAYASESEPANNAISAAYELGITSGVGDGTMFDPSGTIPRRDMATFIVRALNHSNLRPAGLTAQISGTTVTVSVRDANFAPVVNVDVDAFKAAAAQESRAFNDDGNCTGRTTGFTGEGSEKCEIDGADPVTGTDGNVELSTLEGMVGEGLTVWVWTGDIGDKVDSDTALYRLPVPKGAADPVTKANAIVTTDLPMQADGQSQVTRARFGRTVTVTIQLRGDNGTSADFTDDVNAGPGAGEPDKYNVRVDTFTGTTTQDDTTRVARDSHVVTVNADGAGTFEITARDSDPNDTGQTQTVVYTITPATGATALATTTPAQSPGNIVFDDAPAIPTSMSVKVDGSRPAPGPSGTASNRATVTVLDQYGNPFRGAPVRLFSNDLYDSGTAGDTGSTIRTRAVSTGSRGTVVIGWSYRGNAAEETVVAMWDGFVAGVDLNDNSDFTDDGDRAPVGELGFANVASDGTYTCQPVDSNGVGADVCADAKAHWVGALTSASNSATGLEVLSLDVENGQIIYDGADTGVDPMSVNYDSGDAFTVVSRVDTDGDGDLSDETDQTNPVTLEAFEEALAKALKDSAASDTQFPTLIVTSYVHDDPIDIASFTIDITIDQ